MKKVSLFSLVLVFGFCAAVSADLEQAVQTETTGEVASDVAAPATPATAEGAAADAAQEEDPAVVSTEEQQSQ